MAQRSRKVNLLPDIEPHVQPIYRRMSQPAVAFGPAGELQGRLDKPRGVAYREDTREIYVVDERNSRIQIFLLEGDFVYDFGEDELEMPSNILLLDGALLVTDWGWSGVSLFKFELNTLKLKKKTGRNTFNPETGYNLLRQPSLGPNGHIYIPDNNNNRICVFTKNIDKVKNIDCVGMTSPVDIQFSQELMYVMSNTDKYCIHVCTLSGDKIESVITRGEFRARMQVQFSNYFLRDQNNNFIISDYNDHVIKVFNASGKNLLYKVGVDEMNYPMGMALTRAGELIVVSENILNGVLVFSSQLI